MMRFTWSTKSVDRSLIALDKFYFYFSSYEALDQPIVTSIDVSFAK